VSSHDRDIHYLPLLELAKLIKTRQISPTEVAELTLERVRRLNPQICAYYSVFEDELDVAARNAEREIAKGQHRGPLHGIPIGIKDVFALGPTTAGSELRRNYVATAEATAIRRLKEAGALVLGKLATHEFALGAAALEGGFPAARNPWAPALTPGGSSSGAGAAVAAGMAYGALASDTGGSIRIPASHCGVVGFKPTYGRVSRDGLFPLSWSLDHAGPIGRTVADAAALLDACAGTPFLGLREHLPQKIDKLRIGIPWSYFEDSCSAEILAAFRQAADHLRGLGAVVSEVELGVSHVAAWAAFYLITLPEAAAYHLQDFRSQPDAYGREFRLLLGTGALLGSTTYIQAQRARAVITRRISECLESNDVLMLPTVGSKPEPIPLHWRPLADRMKTRPAPLYTPLFNLAGTPAISVPCGSSNEGLPIGLQFASRPFDEMAVVRAASAYELTTDWKDQHPALI
jgi:aspartyl-tRNA(Asn)/glutamyl-tRNA(Gln) amidotransferase subunit A